MFYTRDDKRGSGSTVGKKLSLSMGICEIRESCWGEHALLLKVPKTQLSRKTATAKLFSKLRIVEESRYSEKRTALNLLSNV